MTSVRRAAKKVAAWDRYTRRYLKPDSWTIKAAKADIVWYGRWVKAKQKSLLKQRGTP